MSATETDAEDKVEPTIRYLQKLGQNHLDLIFDASKWVFEVDRPLGLQVRRLSLPSDRDRMGRADLRGRP
jgi:hypothetical protein